uniref:Uncharacterized protein AlNc14C41G3514 n=1 Tax=Albugo laibachii Nc14 TaxID=890382 RepID=F0W9R0_9STRA|nr:conserved hypothetical protein [Albugo laibachii Nc14]|eukprot:CCA17878.1 conserved hypothetical protein [Albugo laibachii Nc14]
MENNRSPPSRNDSSIDAQRAKLLESVQKYRIEQSTQVGDFSWVDHTLGRKSLITRAKENPAVPLGCLATVAILGGGLLSFHRGQSKLGNRAAQAATILALIGGAMYASMNEPKRDRSCNKLPKHD